MPTLEHRARTAADEVYVEAQSQIRRMQPAVDLHARMTREQVMQFGVLSSAIAGLPRLLAHWRDVTDAKARIDAQRAKTSA
jgi:hypothetical protein